MKRIILSLLTLLTIFSLSSCENISELDSNNPSNNEANNSFTNPGDYLGGGNEVSEVPTYTSSSNVENITNYLPNIEYNNEIPSGSIAITGKTTITEAGNYFVSGEVNGKITVSVEGVHIYLNNANITNEKKVIESDYGLTITLINNNVITNTNTDGSNAIDCVGDLIISGSGSLSITSTKNSIKANSISIIDSTIIINSDKDGIHAEIDKYDEASDTPNASYDDGGYVYLSNANINITSVDDGIQADTFIYITDNSIINIGAGNGAPETITETSSDNANGKGIKVGAIDYSADGIDLDWDGYLLYIDSADITINSNDDALHSNGEVVINGGNFSLASGDDAIHADNLLEITAGEIVVECCYEGLEAAKVEISGGNIIVNSSEDGINAADGTTAIPGQANSNCHIIISGGYIEVNCVGTEGDGIDSNGTVLITGGEIYVSGSTNNADSALDSDGGILVNGGYLFAVGPLGMVETPGNNSSQYVISYARNEAISAGTIIYLCDSEGNIITYFTTIRSCQSIIISAPELEKGKTYSIYGGDSLLTTCTISSTITTIGSSSSITNPGGNPGSRPGSGIPGRH